MKLWDRLTGKAQARAEAKLKDRYETQIEGMRDRHLNEIREIMHVVFEAGVILYQEQKHVEINALGSSYVETTPGVWRWAARPRPLPTEWDGYIKP